jgi:hypothetical protein
VAKIDGKAGMNTRALVGAYQHSAGLKVDCWPSEAVLGSLRKGVAPAKAVQPPVKSSLGAEAIKAK